MRGGAVRQQQLFASGERDSGVEHLVHLTKLVSSKSVLKDRGIQEEPHPISDAMATRLFRRNVETEKRIREGNAMLLEKIRRVQSDEERVARHSTLVPKGNQYRGFYQGSNQHARTLEAKRIDTDNVHMIARIHDAQPFVTKKQHKKQNEKHQQLVNRISKFKPNPMFAGEGILNPKKANQRAQQLPQIKEDKETQQLRERGWGDVMRADMETYHKRRDRELRGEDVADPVQEERRERLRAQQEKALKAISGPMQTGAPVRGFATTQQNHHLSTTARSTTEADRKPRPPPAKRSGGASTSRSTRPVQQHSQQSQQQQENEGEIQQRQIEYEPHPPPAKQREQPKDREEQLQQEEPQSARPDTSEKRPVEQKEEVPTQEEVVDPVSEGAQEEPEDIEQKEEQKEEEEKEEAAPPQEEEKPTAVIQNEEEVLNIQCIIRRTQASRLIEERRTTAATSS